MHDIRTIPDLIEALGGDTVVAEQFGISQPAVANWKVRQDIPGGWHMRLFAWALAEGKSVDTVAIFGLSPAEAAAIMPARPTRHHARA